MEGSRGLLNCTRIDLSSTRFDCYGCLLVDLGLGVEITLGQSNLSSQKGIYCFISGHLPKRDWDFIVKYFLIPVLSSRMLGKFGTSSHSN